MKNTLESFVHEQTDQQVAFSRTRLTNDAECKTLRRQRVWAAQRIIAGHRNVFDFDWLVKWLGFDFAFLVAKKKAHVFTILLFFNYIDPGDRQART